MKVGDLLLVGLAAIGIYYIGKRYMNDKKVNNQMQADKPAEQLNTETQPYSVNVPTLDGDDLNIIQWVENQ